MRFIKIFIVLVVLTACSKTKVSENELTTANEKDSTGSVLLKSNPTDDSLIYIGAIGKFEDNNSFYTELFFVDDFDYSLFTEITKMGDQIVFQDEDIKRTRIELKKAGRYFNLTGLSDISIYDKHNVKLTTGTLSHIEYVEDPIESGFVGVFDVVNTDVSDHQFCIGNVEGDLEEVTFDSYKDDKLESAIINHLHLNKATILGVAHYRFNDQTSYSTVSADTTAYVIETNNDVHTTLYKSKYSESIDELNMISKKINGRQILIADCIAPDGDMTWTTLLIFNGTTYESNGNHRIKN